MNEQIIRERNKRVGAIEKLLDGPMIFPGFVWLVLLVIELERALSQVFEYVSLCAWISSLLILPLNTF